MTDRGDDKSERREQYWKYLEENSKTVSTWPDWLRGGRTSGTESKVDKTEPEIESQRSVAKGLS
jgi:hypothetical protein